MDLSTVLNIGATFLPTWWQHRSIKFNSFFLPYSIISLLKLCMVTIDALCVYLTGADLIHMCNAAIFKYIATPLSMIVTPNALGNPRGLKLYSLTR